MFQPNGWKILIFLSFKDSVWISFRLDFNIFQMGLIYLLIHLRLLYVSAPLSEKESKHSSKEKKKKKKKSKEVKLHITY